MTRSGVYFLEGAGRIKIGHARDVDKRVTGIAYCSPVSLTLLGMIPASQPMVLEAWLHKRYAALRQHGEWFEPCDEMLSLARGDVQLTWLGLGEAAEQLGVPESELRRSPLVAPLGPREGLRVVGLDLAALARELDIERARRWARQWVKEALEGAALSIAAARPDGPE